MEEHHDEDFPTSEPMSEPILEDFQYEPLNISKQQIRLFKIQLANRNEPPKCSIETFDLADGPPFKATSYTWGVPSPTFNVHVNGRRMLVRENLFLFLSTFEDEDYLWVDQICIDQSNVEERNHQVGLMASIYSQCNCVIVWLGQISRMPSAPVVFNATQGVEALAALLQQDYFTRLWIVQEVLLAKNLDVIVNHPLLKNVSVSWKSMCSIALQSAGTLRSLGVPSSALALLTEYGETRYLGFEPIISTFSHGHCQDSRDKVYGLMGLVNAAERLTVDYRKSVHEVYLDVIRALCKSYKQKRQPFPFRIQRSTLEDYYTISLLLGTRMGFTGTQLQTLTNFLQSLWTSKILNQPPLSKHLGESPVTAMGFQKATLESNHDQMQEGCHSGLVRHDMSDKIHPENRKQPTYYWWYICNGITYRFSPSLSQSET